MSEAMCAVMKRDRRKEKKREKKRKSDLLIKVD